MIGAVGLALVMVLGCGRGAGPGVAWPKSAGTEPVTDPADDGGESLEPQTSHRPVAAIEINDDEPAAIVDPPVEADPAPSATTETPVSAPIGETVEIQIEEIQISPGDIVITP